MAREIGRQNYPADGVQQSMGDGAIGELARRIRTRSGWVWDM